MDDQPTSPRTRLQTSGTRAYDAVFLDAQGTLLKPHPSTAAIYAGICRRFGRSTSAREVARLLSELWVEFKLTLQVGNGIHDTSEEATREWWAAFNTRVFRRLGLQARLEPFLEGLWEAFGRPESWRLFPEVAGVLAELRARGYLLGVVSNWDSRLVLICEGLGLAPRLDFILASASTGMEKPDRRIFEIALERAGVAPSRAIHVGDDYEMDVLGARAAGIDAVLIDRKGVSTRPVAAIRSLDQLLATLL